MVPKQGAKNSGQDIKKGQGQGQGQGQGCRKIFIYFTITLYFNKKQSL